MLKKIGVIIITVLCIGVFSEARSQWDPQENERNRQTSERLKREMDEAARQRHYKMLRENLKNYGRSSPEVRKDNGFIYR